MYNMSSILKSNGDAKIKFTGDWWFVLFNEYRLNILLFFQMTHIHTESIWNNICGSHFQTERMRKPFSNRMFAEAIYKQKNMRDPFSIRWYVESIFSNRIYVESIFKQYSTGGIHFQTEICGIHFQTEYMQCINGNGL